ncbi:MAG: ISL3 family transposase, partial [Micromonosporaceae bacterium]
MLFATEGPDTGTVTKFAADLSAHGGDPTQMHTTSSDLSAAFLRGIRGLPAERGAELRALPPGPEPVRAAVRRAEVTTRPELRHTRWRWLKNWANLSTAGRRERPRLLRPWAQLATGGALRRRADFQA